MYKIREVDVLMRSFYNGHFLVRQGLNCNSPQDPNIWQSTTLILFQLHMLAGSLYQIEISSAHMNCH